MPYPLFQVDAFTDRPFAGNPAAVCLLNEMAEPAWMGNVAAEMNLSETAFVYPLAARENEWSLHWFTPAMEVDLCGHATLAAAHVLWETDRLKPEMPARFHTRSGLLTASRSEDGWIELALPMTLAKKTEPPEGLLDALGVAGSPPVGRSKFDWLVELSTEADVRSLSPDFRLLKQIDCRGVIVTARSAPPYDFISRFFAPAVGINEDPVTGSAHCALAPWWAERLRKRNMLAYQASARGGIVRICLEQDAWLGGKAVTVVRGELA